MLPAPLGRQTCASDDDCRESEICLYDHERRAMYCSHGDCSVNADCPPYARCTSVVNAQTGRSIMMCVGDGKAPVGSGCIELSFDPQKQCAPGLLCVGRICRGRCQSQGDCDDGLVCTTKPGASFGYCRPTCLESNCPAPSRCIDTGQGAVCARQIGQNCLADGCPLGSTCQLYAEPGLVAFWCAAACDPFDAGVCGKDAVCGVGSTTSSVCYAQCSPPPHRKDCPRGFACITVTEDLSSWGCVPTE
jgi:hypothetical protein